METAVGDIDRACFECDRKYCGGLKCPECGENAGEPIDNKGAERCGRI